MAAVDYFLKLDGITGESTDDKHKGEINLDTFSWGLSQSARATGGGGAATGKVQFQDFHFTMPVNTASPQLFAATATGRHLKSAILVGRKAGGDPTSANEFLKYSFTDVLLSAYGEDGTPALLEDRAAFRYASVRATVDIGPHTLSPAAFGAISFDPSTGKATIVEGAEPHLGVGAFQSPDGGPLTFQRGLVEFDLFDIRPILSGPGDPHLTLTLTEIREAAIPADSANIASALSDDDNTPPPGKRNRFIVLWYAPDDLVLTPDDFDRPAHRLTQIVLDPTQPPAQFSLDLTKLVNRKELDQLGIRLQSALDHSRREEDDDEDPTNTDNADDNHNDEETTPSGATNAQFDVSLDLSFG
jgi:type VI secretion system secreted protein Hcp